MPPIAAIFTGSAMFSILVVYILSKIGSLEASVADQGKMIRCMSRSIEKLQADCFLANETALFATKEANRANGRLDEIAAEEQKSRDRLIDFYSKVIDETKTGWNYAEEVS